MQRHFDAAMHVIPWDESDRIAGWRAIAGEPAFPAGVTSSQCRVRCAPEASAIRSYDGVRTDLALRSLQSIAGAQRGHKESV
ncbi:hypothetical protein PHO31112_00877 [Pandoraea horticolens]|uniref:Uncharacterized protein n=1 Tax=Pandoraea horticolens TaxID=2508298 RepID=A0A5E4SLJ4_9BURK|nr:hypothetical protein PHO31112_00877 [Pandoraea horticolens]